MLSCFFFYIIAQKMKFSTKDFFSKSDQIRTFLRIWSHLQKKSLMENFIFCAVYIVSIELVTVRIGRSFINSLSKN